MNVHPEMYHPQVSQHLQKNQPSLSEGERQKQVESLSVSIADEVNRQLNQVKRKPKESIEAVTKRLQSAQILAESEAMRTFLPVDEKEAALIGQSGGYEDQTTESETSES